MPVGNGRLHILKEKGLIDADLDDEEEQFKRAARVILAFSDEQVHQLVVSGQFEEVSKDG